MSEERNEEVIKVAERRMFAKTIIDSDAFLDMSVTARLLYYDLSMRADDDGFVNSPKKIMRMIGASEDDLRMLAARKFIIPFDNGVVVIKHWKIHNYIRKDTYRETSYKEQKELLELDENNSYRLLPLVDDTSTIRGRSVYDPSTQDSIGYSKDIVRDNINNNIPTPKPSKHKYGEHSNVLLTDDEYQKLIDRFPDDYIDRINELSTGLALYGYKYKSHYLAILKWAEKDRKKHNVTNKISHNQDGDNIFLSIAHDEGMI